jgi:hypothetical protein
MQHKKDDEKQGFTVFLVSFWFSRYLDIPAQVAVLSAVLFEFKKEIPTCLEIPLFGLQLPRTNLSSSLMKAGFICS